MHVNIRSISQNFDDLVVYIDSLPNKPSVICLSEAWINDDFDSDVYKIPAYSPSIFDPGKCRNDGVVMFVHNTITFDEEQIDSTLNIVGAKCVTQNRDFFCILRI